jgi:hypothetical protein
MVPVVYVNSTVLYYYTINMGSDWCTIKRLRSNRVINSSVYFSNYTTYFGLNIIR